MKSSVLEILSKCAECEKCSICRTYMGSPVCKPVKLEDKPIECPMEDK